MENLSRREVMKGAASAALAAALPMPAVQGAARSRSAWCSLSRGASNFSATRPSLGWISPRPRSMRLVASAALPSN